MPTLNLAIPISSETQADLITSWKSQVINSVGSLAAASTTASTQTLILSVPVTLPQGACLLIGGQVYQSTAAVSNSASVAVSSNIFGTGSVAQSIGANVSLLNYPDPFSAYSAQYELQSLRAMSLALGSASAIFGSTTATGSFD